MIDRDVIYKSLQPRIVVKSFQSLDHPSLSVVIISWVVAFLMIVLATYALNLSYEVKHRARTMVEQSSVGLNIHHQKIDADKAQFLVDHFQQLYPDLHFVIKNDSFINVSTNDGTKFRQWLSALNDVEDSTPELRWSIETFCVGRCPDATLMNAVLSAESIGFFSP